MPNKKWDFMQICSNFDLFDLPTYLGSVVCINKRANKEQRNKYSINHFAQSSLSPYFAKV